MADDIDVAELEAWAAGLAEIHARIAPRFARSEPRALDAGVPVGWVTADEVYGQHIGLRQFLEERRTPYVLAIPTSHRLWADTDCGPARRRAARPGLETDLRRRRGQGQREQRV